MKISHALCSQRAQLGVFKVRIAVAANETFEAANSRKAAQAVRHRPLHLPRYGLQGRSATALAENVSGVPPLRSSPARSAPDDRAEGAGRIWKRRWRN